MPTPALIKGALQRIVDAIAEARRARETMELPKEVFYDAWGVPSEEALLNGAGIRKYAETPVRLRNENVAVRAEPRGLSPFSELAHYDLTGGTQLPSLGSLWRSGDDAFDETLEGIDNLRLLDFDELRRRVQPNRVKLHNIDPFMHEGMVEGTPYKHRYGVYVNDAEGSHNLNDFLRSGLSYNIDPATRAAMNLSLYVPRRSILYKKPLVLGKKRGGAVRKGN